MLGSKTKDRMWGSKHYADCSSGLLCVGSAAPLPFSLEKEDQRSYVRIETLRGLLFWTPVCGKCCPSYSLDLSPCHEIKRMVQRPPFSNFKWPKFGHDPMFRELNSNGLLDAIKKLPARWKCVIETRGTTLNDVMWKLTRMNKFDWFLGVCALLLEWTSYVRFLPPWIRRPRNWGYNFKVCGIW